MNKAEELFLAWVAGIIDGEGCISLTRRAPQKGSRSVNPNYRLVLKVTMCCSATIRRLHEGLGVGSLHTQAKQKAHYSAAWIWFANATAAGAVLRKVLPYMFTKRREAELALEFLDLLASSPVKRGGSRGSDPMTRSNVAAREKYWRQLRNLKSRNKAKDRKDFA